MDIPRTADIVIVGGGVMGASIAYHLTARGEKHILLLEKEQFFGQGATGRCAGGVRYQFSTEINIRLSSISLPMLERSEDEIGQPIDYRQCGYLILITNQKDLDQFKHNIQLQHRLGVQTIWLDGDEIRDRLPMMNLDLNRMSIAPGKSPTLKPPQPACPYWKMRDCYPIGLVFMRTHQMPIQFLDLLS